LSTFGTLNEDESDLSKEDSKVIRNRSLKLLISLIQPVKKRLYLSFGIGILSQLLRVIGPAIIAYALDTALPAAVNDDQIPLLTAVGGYLLVAVATASMTAFFIRYGARINQDVLLDLRQRMFRHTQKLSVEFHERYTSGRVIARQTSDLDSIRELLDTGGNEMVVSLMFMIFTGGALLILDPQSFLVLMASWIPLYFITRWFIRSARLQYRRSRVASARLIVYFVETMTGIRAVKAFRTEKRNQQKYGDLNEDYRRITKRTIQLFGIFDPSLIFTGSVAMTFVLLFSGSRVIEGELGIGVLTAALLYTRQFFGPIERIAVFYNSYQAASAALEKISGVLEEEPTVPEPEKPAELKKIQGELDFDKVSFNYSNNVPVLPEFSLNIPAGQTIAMVGTTGAGKSTLAKLISRFYDPVLGSVSLDGIDLREISSTDLRRHIVMVTQEAYLFSGSVSDNIALGKPGASAEEVAAAAQAVGAHEFIMQLPDGYDTDVNKRGGRVSAGQRQLISFARAFLADPSVLILDEATSSLDIPSERQVQLGLQTLLKGRTAIIIAHRLSTVAIADRVLVMEHGRIIEDDSPSKLIEGEGKFSKLHKAWRESLV